MKDGYLLIDDCVWQRYGKKLEGVSFVWDRGDWEKSVGDECRFVDLDRRQATDSALVADLATRRKIEVKTRRRNALVSSKAWRNSNVCII